ncbi:MAG TPA: patatin-like phospholipase family protein [Friedmanniella sp.]
MTWDALVLGGGGVAGIAWETGVLLGLCEADPRTGDFLTAATTAYIGTSAGSTVAAQLSSGAGLDDLYEAQVEQRAHELTRTLDLVAFGTMMAGATAGATSPTEVRRRIGEVARRADTPSPQVRRAVIESRLPSDAWPDRDLRITAIDAMTGELRVFDRSSGVALVDAVAASCAVPGVWPTVELDGSSYMDGGVRSVSNLDLAAGAEKVLVLVPGPPTSPLGPTVTTEERAALGDADVEVLHADEESVAAFGPNPLDPDRRGPAARAGRRQGRAARAAIASLLG